MDRAVSAIEELAPPLSVAELKVKYLEAFGETSRSSNKDYLFRRITWPLQANAEGIADDADLHIRAPRGFLPSPICLDDLGRIRISAGRYSSGELYDSNDPRAWLARACNYRNWSGMAH